jgi:hypothetical protein
MSNIDLNPIQNNPGLPESFKQHILKRIREQNGKYGIAWRLIHCNREGRYCLAKRAGEKLCLNTVNAPSM